MLQIRKMFNSLFKVQWFQMYGWKMILTGGSLAKETPDFQSFFKFPFFLSSFLLRPRTGWRLSDLLSTRNFRSTRRTSRQAICPSSWTRARCLWMSSVNTCPTTPRSGRSPGTGSDLVSAHTEAAGRDERGWQRVGGNMEL